MFLTEKQAAVLAFLRDFIEDKGYSPTLEEMSQYFGVSKVTVYEHVKALEEKGAVRKQANRKRAIELVDADGGAEVEHLQSRVAALETENASLRRGPASTLDIRGRVAAGAFVEAVEDLETFALTDVSGDLADCYMLRVEGDSMINAHICPGDLVIVQPAQTARDGEIVVAMVDDEATAGRKATIKRLFREKDHIRLQPENDALPPLLVKDVEVTGRVLGVVRTRV